MPASMTGGHEISETAVSQTLVTRSTRMPRKSPSRAAAAFNSFLSDVSSFSNSVASMTVDPLPRERL